MVMRQSTPNHPINYDRYEAESLPIEQRAHSYVARFLKVGIFSLFCLISTECLALRTACHLDYPGGAIASNVSSTELNTQKNGFQFMCFIPP